MDKKVLITGVTGQDGSYMADYLLENTQHRVYGAVRRVVGRDLKNLDEAVKNDRFAVIGMDLTDPVSINRVVEQIKPDYFINFAANSFVGNSWDMPVNHFETNAMGVLYCLEAIRTIRPTCRFYNAGSSEQWGDVLYSPQDEDHRFRPRSPYAASKCAAHHLVKVYRESYGLYAVQGLLTNHESERRGEEFVTQKIAREVARIYKELCVFLRDGSVVVPMELGNLDAKRDWSHAKDFIDGVWKMLNQEEYKPKMKEAPLKSGRILIPCEIKSDVELMSKHVTDYVLSSGKAHSVREFVEEAFKEARITGLEWRGSDDPLDEVLYHHATKKVVLKINPEFYRPAEVETLLGCSQKARTELGWDPKIDFKTLVKMMVNNKML